MSGAHVFNMLSSSDCRYGNCITGSYFAPPTVAAANELTLHHLCNVSKAIMAFSFIAIACM